jgi:hypothetical protein
MSVWTYKGEVVPDDDISHELYGFIYVINYTDGTKYIGKKNFWTDRRLKPRKTDRVNAKRIKRVETNWRTYEGSSKLSHGKTVESKEIVRLCNTKTELTYYEVYHLMVAKVLFDETYLNQNILGKFYCGEQLIGSKEYSNGES